MGNRQKIDRKSTKKGPFNSDGKARDNFIAYSDDEQAIPVRMDWFLGGRVFDGFRPCTVVCVSGVNGGEKKRVSSRRVELRI
jgi:hypothetical protein